MLKPSAGLKIGVVCVRNTNAVSVARLQPEGCARLTRGKRLCKLAAGCRSAKKVSKYVLIGQIHFETRCQNNLVANACSTIHGHGIRTSEQRESSADGGIGTQLVVPSHTQTGDGLPRKLSPCVKLLRQLNVDTGHGLPVQRQQGAI